MALAIKLALGAIIVMVFVADNLAFHLNGLADFKRQMMERKRQTQRHLNELVDPNLEEEDPIECANCYRSGKSPPRFGKRTPPQLQMHRLKSSPNFRADDMRQPIGRVARDSGGLSTETASFDYGAVAVSPREERRVEDGKTNGQDE